jgi:hypothetical protein
MMLLENNILYIYIYIGIIYFCGDDIYVYNNVMNYKLLFRFKCSIL